VVLTPRGRLVALIAVVVAALGLVLAFQTLSAGPATSEGRAPDQAAAVPGDDGGAVPGKAAPIVDPGSAGGSDSGSVAAAPLTPTPSAADTDAVAAPSVVVNDRTQPPAVEVPTAASGQLVYASGATAPVTGDRVWTYRVEVEDGLPFDRAEVAAAVHATLSDAGGWLAHGNAFQRVDSEDTDFRLILASPSLTDQLCAPLQTRGRVSCRNGDLVVLNALRWAEGIEDYGGDVASYREYMVNHEVGHRLGRGHVECPGAGEPAPVMMQQTYGLDGCALNSWPLPDE